jgi:hypothetical protein
MPFFLTRSQVNHLIRSVIESRVRPNQLKMGNAEARIGSSLSVELPLRISTEDETLYFLIDGDWDRMQNPLYSIEFFPSTRAGQPSHARYNAWPTVLTQFKFWASQVAAELEEPDPMWLLKHGSVLWEDIPTDAEENEGFAPHEMVQIQRSLERMTQFLISEVKPTKEQLRAINEKLQYLQESAKTQDKKAWAYTAVGVIFTIAAALSLTPEQGHKLFEMTSELFRSIFLKLLA